MQGLSKDVEGLSLCEALLCVFVRECKRTQTHCNTLQYTAARYNTNCAQLVVRAAHRATAGWCAFLYDVSNLLLMIENASENARVHKGSSPTFESACVCMSSLCVSKIDMSVPSTPGKQDRISASFPMQTIN